MHTLLALGVTTILTTAAPAQPSLTTKPLTVTFVRQVTFEEAIAAFANMSQMAIEIDQTVSAELRRSSIGDSTLTMRDVTLEEAIGFLTSQKGLSYRVVDGKKIVIFKQA